jgi:HlyD family secretion protein
MRKILTRLVPALIVVAVLAYILLIRPWDRQEVSTHELVLYGNCDIRQVDLAFNNSERIARILVTEGDKVSQGQLVAELGKERFEQAVAKARATVQAQTQVVARLEAGSRPEEIRRAQADVQAAEADVNDARLYYERVDDLVGVDAESRQTRDNALARLKRSEAQLNAAEATLELAQQGPRQEDIAAARATLEAYQAELALACQYLADANLYSPDDGVIRTRILEPGDMASPQTPVLTLALTDPIWIRGYLDETDLGKVHPGDAATVTTDSYPDKHYSGWVGFISPTAEFTPKSVETPALRTHLVYQVRVYVHNPDNELRLGMPATVTIPLTSGQDG